jgi:hypothetical protein
MMVLFVMLNFTSSGGLFRPELQNGFFGTLHAFWNGAGFVEGIRSLLYFGRDGLSGNVGTLVAWLVIGLLVTAVAGAVERARARGVVREEAVPAAEEAEESEEAEEELEESVAV